MEKESSCRNAGSQQPESLIPSHGGFRRLKSFQLAQLVYDITLRFCDRYISKRSRTHDQMVQAARSGVQNIAEGSVASGTSKKMELKLTNVARASLAELRLDYEDFLRQRSLPLWHRDDPRRIGLVQRRCANADEVAAWVAEQARLIQKKTDTQHRINTEGSTTGASAAPPVSSGASKPSLTLLFPELSANAALVLIGVAMSLLNRQIQALAKSFEEEGGFTERLYQTRKAHRNAPWDQK